MRLYGRVRFGLKVGLDSHWWDKDIVDFRANRFDPHQPRLAALSWELSVYIFKAF